MLPQTEDAPLFACGQTRAWPVQQNDPCPFAGWHEKAANPTRSLLNCKLPLLRTEHRLSVSSSLFSPTSALLLAPDHLHATSDAVTRYSINLDFLSLLHSFALYYRERALVVARRSRICTRVAKKSGAPNRGRRATVVLRASAALFSPLAKVRSGLLTTGSQIAYKNCFIFHTLLILSHKTSPYQSSQATHANSSIL